MSPVPTRFGPRTVRTVGWALIVFGSGLGVGAVWLGSSLLDGYTLQGQPRHPADGALGPGFVLPLLQTCGAGLLLGGVFIAAGIFQARTGRRPPRALGALAWLLFLCVIALSMRVDTSP